MGAHFLVVALAELLLLTPLTLARMGSPLGGEIIRTSLKIVNKEMAPDGFKRMAIVADGVFPAPLLTPTTGDELQVTVYNQLTDPTMRRSTTIHWHGLFQNASAFDDGPAFVSQCPLIPNESYTYDLYLPQDGSYWYHSHLTSQYCDGLRGPLVLYHPDDSHRDYYDIDDENTVITLADWYHKISTEIFPATRGPVVADSTLINGKGRYKGGPKVDLAVVKVVPDKRYRFRLISISCDPGFTFSIDGHSLTVIEADGVSTNLYTVDSIKLFVGQRYSVIVKTDQPIANFWIRANPDSGNTGFDGGINSAILRYEGAPAIEPTTSQQAKPVMFDESQLKPWWDKPMPGKPFPGGADININLNIGFDGAAGRWTVNGITWQQPEVPVLLQLMRGDIRPEQVLPKGSVYFLPKFKSVEISVPGGFPHPIHLHGHDFFVVRSAGSSTYNYDKPIRRDVVAIGGGNDNVTFRFFTDNPGPWFLHCHIEWHLDGGLAVVMAEGGNTLANELAKPSKQWENLCPNYNKNNPDKQFAGGH